jgi:hypothetical protein
MRDEGPEDREQQEALLPGSGGGLASGSAVRPHSAQDRLPAAGYSP